MPILLVFSTVYLYLSLKNRELAMFVLVASLPLYVIRLNIFGIPTTLLEVMILILFAVFVFKNYKDILNRIKLKIRNPKSEIRNQKMTAYPFAPEIILVLVVSFVSLIYAGIGNSVLGAWKAYFFEPIMVYVLVYNILYKKDLSLRENILKLLLPLSIGAFFIAIFSIYQKITGSFIPNELWAHSETRRVTSVFGYPNAVGLYLGPISIMLTAYLLSLKNKYQKLNCDRATCKDWQPFSLNWYKEMPRSDKVLFSFFKITLILSVLAIYFARSEGALVALFFSVIVLLFFSFPGKLLVVARKRMMILLAFVFLLIILVAPLRDFAGNKITLNDFSGQIRKAQWEETGVFLRDSHWLWGAGLHSYQEKIEPYHKQGIYIRNDDPRFDELIEKDPEYQKKHWQALEIFLYPHNIFLNFWVELGLLGMLLFLWIIYKTFYISLSSLNEKQSSSRRLLTLLPAMSMLVIVIHGIVDVPYFKNDLSVLFWLVVAMAGLLVLPTSKSGSSKL